MDYFPLSMGAALSYYTRFSLAPLFLMTFACESPVREINILPAGIWILGVRSSGGLPFRLGCQARRELLENRRLASCHMQMRRRATASAQSACLIAKAMAAPSFLAHSVISREPCNFSSCRRTSYERNSSFGEYHFCWLLVNFVGFSDAETGQIGDGSAARGELVNDLRHTSIHQTN